jgi:hypothetical protein
MSGHNGEYQLNINTLNGETFTIKLFHRTKEDETISYLNTFNQIKQKIKNHFKFRFLDEFIHENNVTVPDGWWKYAKDGDNYVCGATEDVVNKIQKYQDYKQTLIYSDEVLTDNMIIDDDVILEDGDTITVIFND